MSHWRRFGNKTRTQPALGVASSGQVLPFPVPANGDHQASYLLSVPQDARRALARGWLWLGLLALIGSGIYSVLLVASRTPGVNQLLPVADFFRVALVVHVDLSVLVWFVALAGLLWTQSGRAIGLRYAQAALALAGAGTLLMLIAPFAGAGTPIMANYIPVLDGPVFLPASPCSALARRCWSRMR
jgi:cytochrome c oxidase subunit 1